MPIHLPAYVDRACNARFANWIRLALLITCCLDTCRGWMPSLFRTTPSTIWRMLDSWCNIDRVSRVMVEWNYFLLFIVRSNFLNYRGESKRTWDVCKMIRNICKTRFKMDVLASLFSRECRVWDYENPCSIGNYIYVCICREKHWEISSFYALKNTSYFAWFFADL